MAKVKPVYESGSFDLPEEGLHLLRVKEAKVLPKKPKEEGGIERTEFKIRSVVEGGGSDGCGHFENFYTHTKNDFSAARLFGFLVKLGIMKDQDEYDSDLMEDSKFRSRFIQGTIDRLYGADIRIKKNNKGEDQAQSVKYFSQKEVQELLNKMQKKEKPQETVSTPTSTPTPTAEDDDVWK